MDDIVGLIATLCLFGWIPIMVIYKHKIKLEEVRAMRGGANADTLAALGELRREVQALRDTSTKFDMSFDAGLSRLEERVDRLDAERAAGVGAAPVAPVAAPVAPVAAPTPAAWYAGNGAEEPAALRNGRG